MGFYKSRDRKGARISQREIFTNLMDVSSRLEGDALHKFIRLIGRPDQDKLVLDLAELGKAPEPVGPYDYFFRGRVDQGYLRQFQNKVPNEERALYELDLAVDLVMPCPWEKQRFVDALNGIGSPNGDPWKQDGNHLVELWLPWKIGFVSGGNHSITAGILSGQGKVIPTTVSDRKSLLDVVRTDGESWFLEDAPFLRVESGRSAAIFEIGRRLP